MVEQSKMAEAKKGKWDSSDEENDSENKKLTVNKKRKVEVAEIVKVSSTAPPTTVVASNSLLHEVDTAMECASVESVTKLLSVDDISHSLDEPVISPAHSPKPSILIADDSCPATEETTVIIEAAPKVVQIVEHNPLHHGCRSVDQYIRLNFIDQGTYGVVFRARCKKTGKIYALKQVKIGKEAAKVGFPVTALRETNILLALKHPNIVR